MVKIKCSDTFNSRIQSDASLRKRVWFQDVATPAERRRKMIKEGPAEPEQSSSMRIEHTCCCLGFLVGISLIAALVAIILTKDPKIEHTVLRQVHVLMSHGERTPSEKELNMLGVVPDIDTFAPYGTEAMTNEGKMLTYEMGALLRRRYAEFLGPYYSPDNSLVISSNTEISRVTALLISAGLWPPESEQMWNDTTDWQPVPYTYPEAKDDYLLYEENCPRYKQEKDRILREFVKEGLLLPYRDLFQKIAHWTSTNFSTPADAYHLNNLFNIQDDIKVANPKWAKHVKRRLVEVARLEYLMMFHNNLLRKLSGGALLAEIIRAAQRSTAAEWRGVRLYVRTGTPTAVAALLGAAVAPPPRLPDPGAALLVELHERVPDATADTPRAIPPDEQFGFKIYYWDDDSAEPRLMEVPGCNDLCPIERFKELTKYVLSQDYHKDCQLTQNVH